MVFAVLATVAEEEPAWRLTATSTTQSITIPPKGSVVRFIQYDGSHDTRARVAISGSPPANATFAVVVDDAANTALPEAGAPDAGTDETVLPPCGSYALKATGTGTWKEVTGGIESTAPPVAKFGHDFACRGETGTYAPRKSGLARVTLESKSDDVIVVDVELTAITQDDGQDDVPKGAFVTAKVVP